jgi:hypothetical protein
MSDLFCASNNIRFDAHGLLWCGRMALAAITGTVMPRSQ